MHAEKRAHAERDPCRIDALIRTDGRDVVCTVTDLTESGAGLALDGETALPSRFHLALPLLDEHADERLVELRWRSGQAAGVRFVRG